MAIEDLGTSKKRMKEFKYMTPLQVFVIFLLAGSLVILPFLPHLLPCQQLGSFGDHLCHFAKEYNNGLKILFFVFFFIHVFEALLAWKLSRDLQFNTFDQMRWVLQTFYGGLFSLGHLIRMKAAAKKQA